MKALFEDHVVIYKICIQRCVFVPFWLYHAICPCNSFAVLFRLRLPYLPLLYCYNNNKIPDLEKMVKNRVTANASY